MTSLPDIVQATLQRRTLLPDDGPLLLMVSGGGDSVALALLAAQGVLGTRPFRILHVNHLLRAEESDADEAFVRGLAERLGIDAAVARYDVGAFAREERLNLEDAGRRIRYDFAREELDAWCARDGLRRQRARIATAHTLDDRIETFYARSIAGAGMGALSSIAPSRGEVVRPLIDCERRAVRDHLTACGETWREDASNGDTTRQRALVRAQILPAAERLNPSFRTSIARTMDLLAEEDALLGEMAGAFVRDFTRSEDGRVFFESEMMRTLDRVMARRTIRAALAVAFPESSRFEASHIEALVDGLGDRGFARDLPEGLRAVSEYGSMVVSRAADGDARVAPSLLPVPGTAHLGAAGVLEAVETAADDMQGTRYSVVIDVTDLRGELTVDSIRAGDRMRPLGMEGTRKLSDLLVDAKVARRSRSAVPVVRDGDHIVWLAGVRMSDDYRVTPTTRKAARLTWSGGMNAGGTHPSAEEME